MSENKKTWIETMEQRLYNVPVPQKRLNKQACTLYSISKEPVRLIIGAALKDANSMAITSPEFGESYGLEAALSRMLYFYQHFRFTNNIFPNRLTTEQDNTQTTLLVISHRQAYLHLLTHVASVEDHICRGASKTFVDFGIAVFESALSSLGDIETALRNGNMFAVAIDIRKQSMSKAQYEIFYQSIKNIAPELPIYLFGVTGEKNTQDILENVPFSKFKLRTQDVYDWRNFGLPQVSSHSKVLCVCSSDEVESLLSRMENLSNSLNTNKVTFANGQNERQAVIYFSEYLFNLMRSLSAPMRFVESSLVLNSGVVGNQVTTSIESILNHRTLISSSVIWQEYTTICESLYSLLSSANADAVRISEIQAQINNAVHKKQRLGIIVNTRVEAEALTDWVDSQWDSDGMAVVSIFSTDRAWTIDPTDKKLCRRIIFAANLTMETIHWVGIPCEEMTVLCYGFEQNAYENLLESWWNLHGNSSDPFGDKLTLAQRRFHLNVKDSVAKSSIKKPFNIRRVKVLELNLRASTEGIEPATAMHSNWTQPATKYLPNDVQILPCKNSHIIQLVGFKDPIHLNGCRYVCAIREGQFLITSVKNLTANDSVLVHSGSENTSDFSIAMCDELCARFITSSLATFYHGLSWLQDLRILAMNEGVQKAQQKLNTLGADISLEHYLDGVRIDIPSKANLLAIGIASARFSPSEYADGVKTNYETVRKHLNSVGKGLSGLLQGVKSSAALYGPASQTHTVKELIDEFQIISVESVAQWDFSGQDKSEKPTMQTLSAAIARYEGKLKVTNSGIRSLSSSPFDNAEHLGHALDILAGPIYGMHACHSMETALIIDLCKKHKIVYAPNTSSITKGGSWAEYHRTYKGKCVDIGAHLSLGTSRLPSKTLRIHYAWDEDEKVIVLHHIGRHLTTAKT